MPPKKQLKLQTLDAFVTRKVGHAGGAKKRKHSATVHSSSSSPAAEEEIVGDDHTMRITRSKSKLDDKETHCVLSSSESPSSSSSGEELDSASSSEEEEELTPKKKKKVKEAVIPKASAREESAVKSQTRSHTTVDANAFKFGNKLPDNYCTIVDEEKRKQFIEKLKQIIKQSKEDEKEKVLQNPNAQDLSIAPNNAKYTPLEQQVIALKKKYPNILLLVEVGYRYKFFGKDAEIASQVLGIVAYKHKNFFNASIPTPRLGIHLRRLVNSGYKAAIVRQTETAAVKAVESKKGPFSRDLDCIYTKSTLVIDDQQEQMLMDIRTSSQCGHLATVVEHKISKDRVKIALVAIDVSTGEILYDEFEDGFMRRELETRMCKIDLSELLLPASRLTDESEKCLEAFIFKPNGNHARIERMEKMSYHLKVIKQEIKEFFDSEEDKEDKKLEKSRLVETILAFSDQIILALGLIFQYLKQFKLETAFTLGIHFHCLSTQHCINLKAITLRNLEIIQNNVDGTSRGTLYEKMNKTNTPFGARLLKKWLCYPLVKENDINMRLNAVEEIVSGKSSFLKDIQQCIRTMPDLEKNLMRIYYKKCSPKELLLLLAAFESLFHVLGDMESWKSQVNSELLTQLFSNIPNVKEKVTEYLTRFSHSAARKNDKTALFIEADAQFPEIQMYYKASKEIRNYLENEHLREIRKLIKKEVSFKSVVGRTFVIEVPVSKAKDVPSDWIKINQTKTVIRYHTPVVLEKLKLIQYNDDKLASACNEAWGKMLSYISQDFNEFKRIVVQIATLDCLFAFAQLAQINNYVKPIVIAEDKKRELVIKDGRHPIIESLMNDIPYVPNSINLKEDGVTSVVIFGPNMGGKSSYMKQVALISIMAQVGCYVPAKMCRLSPFDEIFTRMGARDNMAGGESTFMVEVSEASDMLRHSTARSLTIWDELGRGTSTHDGSAIAYATLKYLVEHIQCFSLFVTHYPILAKLEPQYPLKIANFHMAFMSNEDTEESQQPKDHKSITFLYKLIQGHASRSYGLNVARLAGLSNNILDIASQKSLEFEQQMRTREQVSCYANLYQKMSNVGEESTNDDILQFRRDLIELTAHIDH